MRHNPREDFEADLVAALPRLRRYALSLSRRGDVADDLVQICVEKAIGARDRYDPDTRLEPWLFRILRNSWFDMTRRSATRGVEVEISDAPDAAVVDGPSVTENMLMLKKTEAALATLSVEHREVITLVCFEEMSYAEAAEVLGIPKGTVMSRLARGRAALSEKLGIV